MRTSGNPKDYGPLSRYAAVSSFHIVRTSGNLSGAAVTPAAERKRKERRLKREDRIEVRVEISRAARDALIEAHQLSEWSEDDPEAIRAAVQNHIDHLRPVTA